MFFLKLNDPYDNMVDHYALFLDEGCDDMKAGKSIIDNLPIRWLLSMSIAVIGIAVCMWLWVKPQWEQQAESWMDLNDEIKMLMAADSKQLETNRTMGEVVHPNNRNRSSAQLNDYAKIDENSMGTTPKHETTTVPNSLTVPTMIRKIDTQRINVNKANAATLLTLPGIGPSKARAIIEYREKKGSFDHVEDLIKVKGIGKKLLGKIRGKVCVD